MKHYFEYLPRVDYDMGRAGVKQRAVDISRRFVIENLIKDKPVIYRTYFCAGDRPDQVAEKVYGDALLDWLILMTNQVIDPFFQWPMDHFQFTEHIKAKYGSLSVAHQTVHHYEWIVRPESRQLDGTVVPERVIIVDQTTYTSLVDNTRRSISLFDEEQRRNDRRKNLRYIDKRFVPQIKDEVEKVFA